jgi:hypothetical protein
MLKFENIEIYYSFIDKLCLLQDSINEWTITYKSYFIFNYIY